MKTVQLIVECSDDTDRDEWLGRLGVVKYRLPMIHSYVIEIPEAKVNQLSGIRGIKTIHRTATITAQMNTARKSVQADKVHSRGFNGRGVTIAILDTGVSPVDDFTKPKNRIVAWKDIVNGRDSCYDDNGHGTHVAVR